MVITIHQINQGNRCRFITDQATVAQTFLNGRELLNFKVSIWMYYWYYRGYNISFQGTLLNVCCSNIFKRGTFKLKAFLKLRNDRETEPQKYKIHSQIYWSLYNYRRLSRICVLDETHLFHCFNKYMLILLQHHYKVKTPQGYYSYC